MEGITNLRVLNSVMMEENALILEFEACRDETLLATFDDLADPDSDRLIDAFRNGMYEKFELKISGHSVTGFYEGIQAIYADKEPVYLEFEDPKILRFWIFSETGGGYNEMQDILYESLEIKEL